MRGFDIQLLGAHNLENVLAAVCVAMCMGVPPNAIQKQSKNFAGFRGAWNW